MIVVFHHFSTHFWLSWFSFRRNRTFQVHDVIINFFFFYSCFLFFFEWSILGNIACRRWPSSLKHLFSCEDFLKRLAFGPGLLVSFMSREKLWLKSIPREMGNFGQCASKHQSRWFQRITILGVVFFLGYWKSFGQLEAVASLDAYQITKC